MADFFPEPSQALYYVEDFPSIVGKEVEVDVFYDVCGYPSVSPYLKPPPTYYSYPSIGLLECESRPVALANMYLPGKNGGNIYLIIN